MILFVDDERRKMDSYFRELKLSGYEEVEFRSDVDEAWKFFNENYKQIKLLILDVMMSPGKEFQNDDNKQGLRTGIHFYNRIRKEHPQLPIIIFTNIPDDQVAEKIGKDEKSWFLYKDNFLPFELVDEIREILENE